MYMFVHYTEKKTVVKIFSAPQWGPRHPAPSLLAMPMTPVQTFIVNVSDEDGKAMSTESADEGDVSSRTLGRQYNNPPMSIGPAEFLELYRTRTVSDPRSDQRLDALSRVRMRKVQYAQSAYYLSCWGYT